MILGHELFERQHTFVELDQQKKNEDHRRSHRQAQDGTALDQINKETRELSEQCLQCHLTRSSGASSIISRGLQVPPVPSHEVIKLPPDEAETGTSFRTT